MNYTFLQVAYTFDAGPNAVLFLEQAEISRFASVFFSVFGSTPHDHFLRGKVPDLVDPTEDVASLVPEKALKVKCNIRM